MPQFKQTDQMLVWSETAKKLFIAGGVAGYTQRYSYFKEMLKGISHTEIHTSLCVMEIPLLVMYSRKTSGYVYQKINRRMFMLTLLTTANIWK